MSGVQGFGGDGCGGAASERATHEDPGGDAQLQLGAEESHPEDIQQWILTG